MFFVFTFGGLALLGLLAGRSADLSYHDQYDRYAIFGALHGRASFSGNGRLPEMRGSDSLTSDFDYGRETETQYFIRLARLDQYERAAARAEARRARWAAFFSRLITRLRSSTARTHRAEMLGTEELTIS